MNLYTFKQNSPKIPNFRWIHWKLSENVDIILQMRIDQCYGIVLDSNF